MTSFEKIKKHLPKKYKEIKDLIGTFAGICLFTNWNVKDQIKNDKDLNANKYFGVYKLCIETKDPKMIETSIYHIHVGHSKKISWLEINFTWISRW